MYVVEIQKCLFSSILEIDFEILLKNHKCLFYAQIFPHNSSLLEHTHMHTLAEISTEANKKCKTEKKKKKRKK